MIDKDNFLDVLPMDGSQTTQTFAAFESVRCSWASDDTLSRAGDDWIYGNFSNSLPGAVESEVRSRIARKAVLLIVHAGEFEGKPVHMFIHS